MSLQSRSLALNHHHARGLRSQAGRQSNILFTSLTPHIPLRYYCRTALYTEVLRSRLLYIEFYVMMHVMTFILAGKLARYNTCI